MKKNSYNYTYNCFDREIYEDFINENIEKSSSEIVNVEDIYNYFYDNLIDDYKLVDFDLKITENYLKSDSYKGFHNLFVKDIINIFKELEFEKMQSKKKDENSAKTGTKKKQLMMLFPNMKGSDVDLLSKLTTQKEIDAHLRELG